MTSNLSPRVLLPIALFVALVSRAGAETQVGGVVDSGDPAAPTVERPIVAVRGETPYVEINGKQVAVPLNRLKLHPSDGPFHSSRGAAPAWVFTSKLSARRKLNSNVDSMNLTNIHNVLEFSVDLESPTLIDKVWILVTMGSDTGYHETLVQEVGTLRPYKLKSLSIERRLYQDLGDDPHVDLSVFAQNREVFHSLMDLDIVTSGITGIIARVRQGVTDGETEPYLTFPPREASRAKNPVKLDLDIDRHGSVKSATVTDSSDPRTEKNLLEAVKHWWFLPKRVDGKSVDCQVAVLVDLAKWEQWSNGNVTLRAASRSAAAAPKEKAISLSLNPQEQTGPTGAAARTGLALPVAVFQVLPVLPEQMSRLGIEGKATVGFLVLPDGTVQSAEAVSQTEELFGAAAAECVRQWRFRPALQDGVPVGMRLTVPVVFTFAGCLPASPYDGFYDQAYLAAHYIAQERAQAMAERVAGLKFPVGLAELYAALGIPGGQLGVLRRLDFDGTTHNAHYQVTALGPAGKYYALKISYGPNEQGSFANPRVNQAEVVLANPLPTPNFKIDRTAGGSPPP